jgi:hypothetical protein
VQIKDDLSLCLHHLPSPILSRIYKANSVILTSATLRFTKPAGLCGEKKRSPARIWWSQTIMTPEEKARQQIDLLLQQSGWIIQDRSKINLSAGPGVAIREALLKTREADYLLFAGGKAIATMSASRNTGGAIQAGQPAARKPLTGAIYSFGKTTAK